MKNPSASWPLQTTAPSANYPYGGAKNVSAPGDGTGTPWVAELVNDIFGFQQALLSAAAITPSGNSETAIASQMKDALDDLYDQTALGTLLVPGLVQLSNDTTSSSNALAATIGALKGVKDLVVPAVANSLTSTGHITLPGGLIVNWGDTSVPDETRVTATFHRAFPTAFLQAFVCMKGIGTSGNSYAQKSTISWVAKDLTGIYIDSARDGGSSIAVSYFAIGY
jgi:hypothetical protein